ncbi:MAG: hypothetical protein CMP59_04065 [Flavobacteriales bacterium]|nr:hypothetical protein [Flavobacteriales bacterium]
MKTDKTFLSYHQIADQDVVVVDGLHPQKTVLSHWKGANVHAEVEADTSGEIAINAIEKGFPGVEAPYVSATHFDIDGFVGVFALFYPELTLKYKSAMIEMARIGDFREYLPKNEGSDLALKLCCWMNKVEKDMFYRPFEEKDEIKSCVPKFEYFLKIFPDVLQQIDQYKTDWEAEYMRVKEDMHLLQEEERVNELGLIIRKAAQPLHYYALFSETEGLDMVLSIYPSNRYELECKYTTWIDLASRPNLPRVDLRPLAEQLNQIEASEQIWEVDRITDTGPILRLESKKLHKAERYAHPFEREIYGSSIEEVEFVKLVKEFLKKGFEGIKPKRFWTWKEMKAGA